MALQRIWIAVATIVLAVSVPMPAGAQTALKTKTTVDVAESTPVFGQPVTFTATVTPMGRWTGTTLVGLVSFDDVTLGEALGTAPVNVDGVASLVVADLTPGTHAIKATFLGSRRHDASSGRTTISVRRDYIVLGADLGS